MIIIKYKNKVGKLKKERTIIPTTNFYTPFHQPMHPLPYLTSQANDDSNKIVGELLNFYY